MQQVQNVMSCRRCLCQFGSFVGNYLEEVGDWESVRREAMWTTTNSNFNMLTPLLQWQARKESCYAFVYYRYRFCLVSLLTLPEHLSSPPVFSGVRVTGSLVLYVCFIYRFLTHFPNPQLPLDNFLQKNQTDTNTFYRTWHFVLAIFTVLSHWFLRFSEPDRNF
jgi:hypothetical protein